MIQVTGMTKKFEGMTALEEISCRIPKGCVYGMVGSNGAGKSTLLRVLSGIYKADQGEVLFEGSPVYGNLKAMERIFLVADEPWFLPQASLKRMAQMYAAFYERFDWGYYQRLREMFRLDEKKPLDTFSKGMKRQASVVLALSCRADVILFDETFDGLDSVMRKLLKQILYQEVAERETTVIVSSHSLRELEDMCDHLALMHQGKLVFAQDMDELKQSLLKVQAAYKDTVPAELFARLKISTMIQEGSVVTMTVRGNRDEILAVLREGNPLLLNTLPLSLEEIFACEMEKLGYSFVGEGGFDE